MWGSESKIPDPGRGLLRRKENQKSWSKTGGTIKETVLSSEFDVHRAGKPWGGGDTAPLCLTKLNE